MIRTNGNDDLELTVFKPEAEADLHNTISFDVFDTLVRRPFVSPDDALRFLELKFQVGGWLAIRKKAETLALQASGKESVSLSQIYAYVPPQWKFMEQEEIKFDLEILRPNKDVLALFNRFRELGKTIIIATDTYYDSQTIAKILESNGYFAYEKIFASCEYGKTKSRGSLFDVILQELSIQDPARMLHIGDNHHSDVDMPKKQGIHVHYLPGVMECFFEQKKFFAIKKFWNLKRKVSIPERIIYSHQLGILAAMHREGCLESLDPFSEIFIYAFPLLLRFFDDFIYNEVQRTGFKDLAFIARDGYLLKGVFDKRHNADNSFNTPYIYATRMILRSLNLDFSHIEPADAIAIIRSLAERHPEIARLFPGVSFSMDASEKIFATFHENIGVIDEIVQKDRDTYLAYIKSTGLYSKDVLCVDWGGIHLTAQRYLEDFFRQTRGIYCNVCHSVDLRIENLISSLLPFYELVEVYITSPEKPICAIQQIEDHFSPIYTEQRACPEIKAIYDLMMHFLDDFDFPAVSYQGLPIQCVMDIYEQVFPNLSEDAYSELHRFGNCGTIAHEVKDYENIWPKLRERCYWRFKMKYQLNNILSILYRKFFKRDPA